MIHAELPKSKLVQMNKTYQKKHTSIISPDKILLNEKLMLSLMFGGMGFVLLSWALAKKN
jgi:hypothetical protein